MGFPFFFVLLFSASAFGQHALHSIPSIPQELLERRVAIRTGVGAVHDDAATKNAEAQRFYDQGLAYLHNYVWIEAARSFHQALRLDSQLALAHVGLSYAYIELNKPAQARQAITTAQALAVKSAQSVDHIKRHVDARALQMAAEDAPGDPSKLAAYRKSLDGAIAAYPNDVQFLLNRGIAESRDVGKRSDSPGHSAATRSRYAAFAERRRWPRRVP